LPAKPSLHYVYYSACIANHPSFLSVPADLDNLVTPTYIIIGNADAMMSEAQVSEAGEKLKKELGANGRVKVYDQAVHGFTIRGDDMIEKEKKQKEDAAKEAMKFVNEVFGA
jgi:dienelactone hydrolase